jgi:A/G-specific adenine glycosylase
MPAKSYIQANVRKFRASLLRWFQREQRKLPWRGESDPYRILVSEIMLQQTRVAVVEDRYKKFVRQFPSVERLARSKEETVLAAWSGLGYYRRARALHASAKEITRVKNGRFPTSAAALQELPGVGRYTAAAVASIAFGEATAVVDGNVQRVLQRLYGNQLSSKACWQAAGELLDRRHPGDFNQAMMELGALICLPGLPLCHVCPVSVLCASQGPGERIRQAPRKKAILRYMLLRQHGRVFLQQRGETNSLMPGMWELPLFPSINDAPESENAPVLKLKHSITNTDYTIFVFASARGNGASGRWVSLRSVERLPLTGLARKILSRLELLS